MLMLAMPSILLFQVSLVYLVSILVLVNISSDISLHFAELSCKTILCLQVGHSGQLSSLLTLLH